jgi:hypothetical protein
MIIPCSVTTGATAISTLASAQYSEGVEEVLNAAAGNYQAEFVNVLRQIPRVSVGTRLINALAAASLGNGALFFRSQADGGVGGSSYVSMVGTNGKVMTVPRTINWSAGGVAVLAMEMAFLSSDGVSAPITVGSTAGDLTAESAEWVGDSDQVKSIDVDFGYDVSYPADGKLYAVHPFIVSQRPKLSYVTFDPTLLTTARVNPGSITTASAVFAQCANGGVRGATLTFTLTGRVRVAQVDGARPGTIQVVCSGTGGFTIS